MENPKWLSEARKVTQKLANLIEQFDEIGSDKGKVKYFSYARSRLVLAQLNVQEAHKRIEREIIKENIQDMKLQSRG